MPSQCFTGDWLWSCRTRISANPERVGKWLIFCSPDRVDEIWRSVSKSMLDGELAKVAVCAKASTAGRDSAKHVICVYSQDYANKDDVGRCLAALRRLGIKAHISYKTDGQTKAGIYSTRERPVAIYTSKDFEKHPFQEQSTFDFS